MHALLQHQVTPILHELSWANVVTGQASAKAQVTIEQQPFLDAKVCGKFGLVEAVLNHKSNLVLRSSIPKIFNIY